MMRTQRAGQRGAALLLAMITVTLVATLAAAAMWRQWRGVEIEAAERARMQSDWILTGALDWGRLILQGDQNEDRKKGQLVDHLAEPWAIPLAEARLSTFLAAGESSSEIDRDAFLSGEVSDLQSRLNIMNLLTGDGVDALQRFERLFSVLGLPGNELGTLQRNLQRAQGAFNQADAVDAPLPPGRLEQLPWLGVSAATLHLLSPYVTLLPLQGKSPTPVNLNTASAEVIHAALPGLDLAQAQRLVALRDQTHFATARQAIDTLKASDVNLDWAGVSSNFFEIRGQLRLDHVALQEVAVVQRASSAQGRNDVRPLWRTRTPLAARPR